MEYPIYTDTGSGEKLILHGIRKDDQGEYLELEGWAEPGVGPPMHVHFLQEEGLTVVQGKLAYMFDDKVVRYAGPGEKVVFKAGQMHRFWNAGQEKLVAKGYVRPIDSFPYFIAHTHASIKANGGKKPGFFDGAYLLWRYRTEFDMAEIPRPVKKIMFPFVVLLGSLLGMAGKFKDAPPPRKR
jgi:mannose-6-phosphate isomerase-like protein (cupin superfamily)